MHADAPPSQALFYLPSNPITDHHSQSPKPIAILSGSNRSDVPFASGASGWSEA
jgi:hypothetical protein